MDGAPVKNETIPVRFYLGQAIEELTPTYEQVNKRFSVKYYLNLVLVDEEERRYFKQHEVIIWRGSNVAPKEASTDKAKKETSQA